MDPTSGDDCQNYPDQEMNVGVRLVVLNLPEDEGEGLGFRLTRTLWDPYPWVHEVTPESRADTAGLKSGDCLLQADGKDLLGLPVGQVAGIIRGDGFGGGVTLLVWNCGVDPKDDPELLWSCGGGARGERARRALAGVVRALACCVCAATAAAAAPLSCARSHLYCEPCWRRLERCALCRETLPSKDSPYARNLVAEQVFEAIAIEYELKNTLRRPTQTSSAYTSPNRSPFASPATIRKGQYQLSMMHRRKALQAEKFASDPNLNRSPKTVQNSQTGNTCQCQSRELPRINIEDAEGNKNEIPNCSVNCQVQHKLIARLRQACSLADLTNVVQPCVMSKSLNNINLGDCDKEKCQQSCSMDNLKNGTIPNEPPVFLVPVPQIYVLACDHDQ